MSRYGPRVAALARRAERERAAFDADAVEANGIGPDATKSHEFGPEEADRYLREGAGKAVAVYLDGRTGGRRVPFSAAELSALEAALNDWLECYALCHGVAIEASVTVREAAEVLLETGNVHDVGQLLTGVPPRREAGNRGTGRRETGRREDERIAEGGTERS